MYILLEVQSWRKILVIKAIRALNDTTLKSTKEYLESFGAISVPEVPTLMLVPLETVGNRDRVRRVLTPYHIDIKWHEISLDEYQQRMERRRDFPMLIPMADPVVPSAFERPARPCLTIEVIDAAFEPVHRKAMENSYEEQFSFRQLLFGVFKAGVELGEKGVVRG